MKKAIYTLSLFLGTTMVLAQTTGQFATYSGNSGDGGVSDALYGYALGDLNSRNAKTSLLDDSIEGSPYMSNIFLYGDLFYGDEKVGSLYYRYNAYNEEVEIKQQNLEKEPIRALSKDKKVKLMVNGKPMSFKTFIDKNGNTKNGYLTLLQDGEYMLYKHLKVTFKDAKKAQNTFVPGSPAKFTQSTQYYLEKTGGKKIVQVELNNKKLLQAVDANDANELKVYLKEKKLKIKDGNDLLSAINYLNNTAKAL